jgi:nucleoside-diphosphate-sugar epimerase
MNESQFINKNLLILGGTGFIGSWAVKKGIKNGYKVSVLSRNIPEISEKIKNVDYIKADISIYKDILKVTKFKKFTHVINLSGEINHANFKSGGRSVIENHFVGLLNLVSCLNRDCLKSFVQVGTSDEYGDSDAPQNEEQTCIPNSNYSLAKLSANNFLQMLNKTEKFPAIIVRLFLVYGPNQNTQRFLPQVISSCLSDKTFPVSKGDQLRDFCFVEDIIDGIFLALESKGLFGNIFNLASGKQVKIRQMVEHIVKLTGKGKPVFGALPYRENENMKLYADVSKANNLLNWKATRDFDDSLKKTIEYYHTNNAQ